MSQLFNPKIPPPPSVAPVKGRDVSAEMRAEAERLSVLRAQGRSSTIVTGAQGDTSQATVQRNTLIGD